MTVIPAGAIPVPPSGRVPSTTAATVRTSVLPSGSTAASPSGWIPSVLAAPVASYSASTRVITWAALVAAISYRIYDDGALVATQTGTTYSVGGTLSGSWTVKAYDLHADSATSNAVTVAVLAAPVISYNSGTRTISWSAITGATTYTPYDDGVAGTPQAGTSYVVPDPSSGSFTVRATAVTGGDSSASNAVNVDALVAAGVATANLLNGSLPNGTYTIKCFTSENHLTMYAEIWQSGTRLDQGTATWPGVESGGYYGAVNLAWSTYSLDVKFNAVTDSATPGAMVWDTVVTSNAFAPSTSPVYGILTPDMTGYTAPSGEAYASSEFSVSYPAWQAFDRLVGDAPIWVSATSWASEYIAYKHAAAVTVRAWTVRSGENYAPDAPLDMYLEGSNDAGVPGTTWNTIASSIGEPSWEGGFTRGYAVATPTQYAQHRLRVAKGQLDPSPQAIITELGLYG